jgi:hypothetical protein
MFVLMVAVLPHLLSDQPPEVPQRVGLGDRFHYFRGSSGRRYLFSTVPRDELVDVRSAVVIVARPAGNGRLAAHWITVLDVFGRPAAGDRRWPPAVGAGELILVHLLSADDRGRHDLVADLSAAPAFALAA